MRILTILLVILTISSCQSKKETVNPLDIKVSKPSKSKNELLSQKYDDDWKNEAELFTFDRFLIYYKGKAVGSKAEDGFWYGTISGDIYVEKGFQRFCCRSVVFKKIGKNKRSLEFLGRR